jgi:uncharacterized protein YjdB
MAKGKEILSIFVTSALVLTMVFGSTAMAYASTILLDVEGHWAQSTIQDMVDEGIIGGYPDGTFRPNNSITRAEFVSLIVKALNLEPDSGRVFGDAANHWAKDAIRIASYYGLVIGYSDSLFGPDDPVTREQMAVIIVNATKLDSIEGDKAFTDSSQIAAWAKEPVAKATVAGLIAGYPEGTFRPKEKATRAEAAIILDRVRRLTQEEVQAKYDRAGIYGPESGTQTIASDASISADGVVLRNTLIEGNLTISREVGNGNVTLNNVTVRGTTFIRGGGKDSIHINGGQYNNVIIESTPDGNIRLVATNAGGIKVIISENAAGEEIILEGTFESVEIKADNIVLTTQGETAINNLRVHENISGTTIDIDKNTTVRELVLDSVTEVNNAKGTVKRIGGDKSSDSAIAFPPEREPSGGGGAGGPSNVSTISVTPTTMALKINGTGTITATVEPTNATNKTVTWTTSDASLATVDNGAVTAKSAGMATITATADGKTATCTVFVESSESDFEFDEETNTITGYEGSGGVVVIPSTIEGVPVEHIGEDAFCKYDEEWDTIPNNITSIVIPNTVTSIEDYAFYDCTSLKSITISNSVTSIGEGAFCECSSLTSAAIPNSVTSIGNYAFVHCESLASVTFQETSSVESIGDSAFGRCIILESMIIPDSVTSIGNCAFYECTSLESVIIPDSVESIGHDAFSDCTSLMSITIPQKVTIINDSTFYGCTGLLTVEFEETSQVVTIDECAFERCTSLESIVLPDSVQSIGEGAFYGCISLESIIIPDSVTSIGKYAFYGTGITRLIIPSGMTSLDDNIFEGWLGLTSIEIPDSVESIGYRTFLGCTGLKSITFAGTSRVASIGEDVFFNCIRLESITIPDSVTSIGKYAFFNCTSLGDITIPDNVKSIGERVFYGCSSLKSINISGRVSEIGVEAFCGTDLTEITIPSSVHTIGKWALVHCINLTKITMEKAGVSIGDGLLASGNNKFRTAYATGGAGTYTGTYDGDWTKIIEPVAVTGVAITGTARVGETLTAVVAPTGATNVTYQWKVADTADGTYADINGATNATLALATAQEGKFIKVVISGDSASTATSTATGPVGALFTPTTDRTTANDEATLGLVGTSVSSSDETVAIAVIAEGKIAITSVGAGSAIITVEDASDHEANIAVTVAADGTITIGEITKV